MEDDFPTRRFPSRWGQGQSNDEHDYNDNPRGHSNRNREATRMNAPQRNSRHWRSVDQIYVPAETTRMDASRRSSGNPRRSFENERDDFRRTDDNQQDRHENARRNSRGRGNSRGRQNQNERNNENPEQENRRSRPRPPRRIGFKYIEELLEKDINEIIMAIYKQRESFSNLLNDDGLTNDTIILIVQLLQKVCSSSFSGATSDFLSIVMQSKFMKILNTFLSSIAQQNRAEQQRSKYFWRDPNTFFDCLITIAKAVHASVPSFAAAAKNMLFNVNVFIPSIEEEQGISIPEPIKTSIKNLRELLKRDVDALEAKRQVKEAPDESGLLPPEDINIIQIIPTAEEILSNCKPFLRQNIIDKAYRSIDTYLDIQFRLLREDFMAPLRKGIKTYLSNETKPKKEREKIHELKFYKNTTFLNVQAVNDSYCYKIKFDMGKQRMSLEKSKRFLFGALVCFTKDNFRTLLFGRIVDRDIKLLKKGHLVVGFSEEVVIDYTSDYLMIESSVYFEPYYHVLRVLQSMDRDQFPMERYILKVENNIRRPRYILDDTRVLFSVKMRRILNNSQYNAFASALNDEFCIIQGPPGTGKTFLGLKIVETLLNNESIWYDDTPILLICYTNHALDQFLENILQVTQRIIRVGGQSKNEALNKYNLMKKRTHSAQNTRHVRDDIRECLAKLNSINHKLDLIDARDCVFDFEEFNFIDNYRTSKVAKLDKENIIRWLMQESNVALFRQGIHARPVNPVPNELFDELDDEEFDFDDDINENLNQDTDIVKKISSNFSSSTLLSLKELAQNKAAYIDELNTVADQPRSSPISLYEKEVTDKLQLTQAYIDYLEIKLPKYVPHQKRLQYEINLIDPFHLSYEERWQLYFHWLDRLSEKLREDYETHLATYRRQVRVLTDLREMEDLKVMQEHLLVGMTTTGAARLRNTLQELKSPIVIVEEAAEILESHIVTALTQDCQHLILIGDHLQLKPSTADYRIEKDYKLGISLFERMVNNNIRCHTLNIQHRMKPEISSLVAPSIYPQLQDHESTLQRKPIVGIEKSLFFITHKERETQDDTSKTNMHEVTFLVALARHLILNNYKPEQITILAAYLAQMYEIKKAVKLAHNAMLLQDVRVTVLDNYQGEESDIILLSLVRNNENNKAGFLRIQNRVCVALTRARDGLYIMGNMDLLLKCNSENEIWNSVNNTLKNQDAIGEHLTLRCQIHLTQVTVKTARDFAAVSEGGCSIVCESLLRCGHRCKKRCHIQDRDHATHQCTESCRKLLCDDPGHICKKLCFELCGLCDYKVTRTLKCYHNAEIECSLNPDEYKCCVVVPIELPCGHETTKRCHVNPDLVKCPVPCGLRLDCGHTCNRSCHVLDDPEHLEYKCRELCARPNIDCSQEEQHTCKNYCCDPCQPCSVPIKKHRSCGHVYDMACCDDVEALLCHKRCKKTLPCSHKCRNECSEPCGKCEVKVEKRILECNHKIKLLCYQTPKKTDCNSKVCPLLLACGHKCKNVCNMPCTDICNEMVDCNIKSPCGHTISRIKCHLKNNNSLDDLWNICNHPCTTILKCKHRCSGTCGECLQSRIHVRCNEKCGATLVCNHECPIPCRETCKPCTQRCQLKCAHSRCAKKCGEPCAPCEMPCRRSCEHIKCTKKCGYICDVDPCTERCQKKLKCNHPCVGFCNDPCPILCKICDEDELTDIFLGREDEPDAIYVMLTDCKHIFEHTDLKEWFKQDENEIKFKVCPRCKTTITTTERYSYYNKQAILDIDKVKTMNFGTLGDNKRLKNNIIQDLGKLTDFVTKFSPDVHQLVKLYKIIINRLAKESRLEQIVNKTELQGLQSIIQILTNLKNCLAKVSISLTEAEILQMKLIVKVLLRSQDRISNQEIDDIEMETSRFIRITQFENIKRMHPIAAQPVQIRILYESISKCLFAKQPYTTKIHSTLETNINLLLKQLRLPVLTESERIEIVRAIGLEKGHWFKCPNGHPYAIGECGGAMQVAKCFCGAMIGGTDHSLLSTNSHAGEMDGSTRHAWPGGLH